MLNPKQNVTPLLDRFKALIREMGLRKTGDVKKIILPSGAEMEMVWCPATTSAEWKACVGGKNFFLMGSYASEVGRGEDETQHRVMLTKGFRIGKYEVTQMQWESVMGSNPSYFKGANRSVETVSWNDCQDFIRKVNAAGQVLVDLPTEAEWEYACRAMMSSPFTFDVVSGSMLNGDNANCDGSKPYGTAKAGPNLQETAVVGSYVPNNWGLHDMHGDVAEWCADWLGDYCGDVINPIGSTSGNSRGCRGGCWATGAKDCRSAKRYVDNIDYCCDYLGFRLVGFSVSEK